MSLNDGDWNTLANKGELVLRLLETRVVICIRLFGVSYQLFFDLQELSVALWTVPTTIFKISQSTCETTSIRRVNLND